MQSTAVFQPIPANMYNMYIIERGSHSSQEKGEREIRRERYMRWNTEPGADGERV
jgi:hypothetical protein